MSFRKLLHGLIWLALAAAVWQVRDELPDAQSWQALANDNLALGALGLWLMMLGASLLRTLRWRLLVSDVYVAPFLTFAGVFGWAFLLTTFTPARAGDLSRPVWIRRQGGSGLHATGALVAERVVDAAVLLVVMFAALYTQPELLALPRSIWSAAAATIALAYVGASMLSGRLFEPRASSADSGTDKAPAGPENTVSGGRLRRFGAGLAVLGRARINLCAVLLTGAIWLMLVGGYFAFLEPIFPRLTLAHAALVLVAVNLSAFVAVLPGNIGLYEVSATAVLVASGADPARAIAAVVLVHGAVLLFVLLYGGLSRAYLQHRGLLRWDVI